jgi:hypothetical protein
VTPAARRGDLPLQRRVKRAAFGANRGDARLAPDDRRLCGGRAGQHPLHGLVAGHTLQKQHICGGQVLGRMEGALNRRFRDA